MANLTRTTRDREEIRRWAEERGGKPSHVKRTGSGGDVGILRIDFPGYTGEDTLESISWEEWFEKFDGRDLVLIYQEETAGGARSNFNQIVDARTTGETPKSDSRATRGAAKKVAKRGKSAASRKKAPAKRKTAQSAARRGGKKTAAKKSSRSARSPKKTASKRAAKTATRKSGAKRRR